MPSEPSEHLENAGITYFRLDVTQDASVQELKHHLISLTSGYLDILVNNA
jgi:1-acylglycerone phosphate reductase